MLLISVLLFKYSADHGCSDVIEASRISPRPKASRCAPRMCVAYGGTAIVKHTCSGSCLKKRKAVESFFSLLSVRLRVDKKFYIC